MSSEHVQPTGKDGRSGPSLEGGSTKRDLALRSPAPGLGIYGKIASAPAGEAPGAVSSALVQRFVLQSAARRLMPLEGVAGCLRRRQGGKDLVDVWHLPEVGRAKFGGLQTCSSVWACPVCAAKITERRRLEVRQAIDAWKVEGGDVALVTFTVRHKSGDELRALVAGMMGALRRVSSGRQGVRLGAEFGVEGMIRSVEVTYGADNGWHPHIHMLVFVKGPMCQFDKLWLHYRRQWDNALHLENMRDVTARGVDMRWANEDVAEYVAKMGHERTWDIEHELAKGPSKLGRGEHFSPVQLLAGFAATGDYELGRLWQVYAQEMKGTHQLRWSPGLRARLGLGKVKSDEEVAGEQDGLGVLLARLDRKQWATVLYFDARAELLNVAAGGDAEAVSWFLQDLDMRWLDDEKQERRVKGSCVDRRTVWTVWDDQREAEAEDLGLTRSEYLRWRYGGVDAMASPVPGAGVVAVSVPVLEAGRGNSSTLRALCRRAVDRGRERIAVLPWLSSPDADPEEADPLDVGSNGYSERFRGL